MFDEMGDDLKCSFGAHCRHTHALWRLKPLIPENMSKMYQKPLTHSVLNDPTVDESWPKKYKCGPTQMAIKVPRRRRWPRL